GAAVSIGLSIAINEIDNDVMAYISDADQVITTTGDIDISALSSSQHLFDLDLDTTEISIENLNDAGNSDGDDPDTPANEFEEDQNDDRIILTALASLFKAKGIELAEIDTIRSDWTYESFETEIELYNGYTVHLDPNYENGGDAGRVYKYIGPDRFDAGTDPVILNLSTVDYTDTTNWEQEPTACKLTTLEENERWMFITGDGTAYMLIKNPQGYLDITLVNINAISSAASIGAAIS
ncbi:MAG: hypothetical protein OMM_14962, partial [Candidatus Magnetoglobus multicellularis str. Araruama]